MCQSDGPMVPAARWEPVAPGRASCRHEQIRTFRPAGLLTRLDRLQHPARRIAVAQPDSDPFPSASPSPTPTPDPPAGLDGRQFLSVDVARDGEPVALVPGTTIRLTFDDGRVGIQAGCNSMSGTYQLDGDRLIVGQMATTEMGCEPDRMAQDQWLSDFLGSEPTLVLSGNDLALTSGGTVITLLDREIAEPDQPLAGVTWGLSSIIANDAVSSVPVGVSATLLFSADGTVAIHDGCNSGGGSYTVDGDVLRLTDVFMTEMACAGAAGQVEQAVLVVLGADAITFAIDADQLTLLASDQGLQYSAARDL